MASRLRHPMWISLYVSALCWHMAFALCPAGWLTIATGGTPAQTCFKVFSGQRAFFDQAATYCINQGGYLARDTSQNIHSSLQSNVASESQSSTHPNHFWIGLTDNNINNGGWMWVGGSALGSYQAFASGSFRNSPNKKDCFYVNAGDSNMKWQKTDNCNQSYSFICQRDFAAAALVSTTSRPIYCPNDWVAFPNRQTCIKLYTSPASWSDARSSCRQAGSDLVRIQDSSFDALVNAQVSTQKSLYWIGLNDRKQEGNFVWLDDTAKTNFTYWLPNWHSNATTNENCVYIDGNQNNQWDDTDCRTQYRYICQRLPMSGRPPFGPPPSPPTNTNCGFGWEDVPNSDSCYMFVSTTLSWLDARTDCQSHGGTLASVISGEEQSYLTGRSASFPVDFFWIGANDRRTEGGWRWTDRSPFAFLNWDFRQPDNRGDADCAVMVQKSGRWNDVPCQNRYGYICKKKGRVTRRSLVTTTTPPSHIAANMMFGCPRGWDNFRGSCYKVVQISTGIDQASASSSCGSPSLQGALAAIIDGDENRFIQSMLPQGTNFTWIGLGDPKENTFTWTDGTPVQYTNWDIGEPDNQNNEDCVVMKSSSGRWSDVSCSSTFDTYVCKKSKSVLPRAGSDEEQGCTNGSIGYGAQCYSYINTLRSFSDAQRDCRTRSKNLGNLATIDSGHLQSFIAAELTTQLNPVYWIGLSQNNDLYRWQSGWPVSFTYWNQNHTGNERWTCGAMLSPSGLWTNYPCNKNFSYICESPRPGFTTAPSPTTRQQPCPAGWSGYTNYCYRVFKPNATATLTWGEARDFCASQANRGSLITVNDNATQTWLLANVIKTSNASGHFWIGLNDRDSESGYVWLDGSPFLYSNWARGQPNDQQNRQDCVEWVLPNNVWNDDYCYVSKNWICQVPRGSIVTTPKPVVTGVQSSLCGNGSWILSNNFCYYLSPSDGDNSAVSWFTARQFCMNMRADLASITGDDENGFITSLISKTSVMTYWIGLNDLDTETYSWSDNSPVGYVSWAFNEPNDAFGGEGCVQMRSNGLWSDYQCQSQFGFICKKRPGGWRRPTATTQSTAGGCPKDFVSLPSLSYCYYVGGTTNDTRKNYNNATTACNQMISKATLASVHSSLEEKFILILTANLRSPAWIGLNDRRVNNQFEWVDNTVVSYTHWGPGQPSENTQDRRPDARRDCVDVEVGRLPGTWNDRQCRSRMAYICEVKKGSSYPTVAPNTTGCHSGYQRFRNSCYKYYRDRDDWTTAQSICVGDGANLVTLSSGVEQAFAEILTGHFNDSLQFWLGLKFDRVSTSFKWADNWPVRFTNWAHGEPDTTGSQDCVTNIVDGQWQVVNCSERHPFVCELNFGSPPPSRVYTGGRCPSNNWLNFAGSCYYIERNSLKSWAGANAACTNFGASLASIHSDTESRYLTNYIGNRVGKDVWIGLFKGQGSGFSWYDGTEVEYVEWARGEPNDPESYLHQDCVKIRSEDGGWADTDCFDQNAYICKTAQMSRTTTAGAHSQSDTGNGGNSGTASMPLSNPGQQGVNGGSSGINGGSSGSSSGINGGSSGLNGGAIAGIVIGVLVIGVLVALVAFFLYRRSQGQIVPPFTKREQILNEPGFDNAAYTSQENKVGFTEA